MSDTAAAPAAPVQQQQPAQPPQQQVDVNAVVQSASQEAQRIATATAKQAAAEAIKETYAKLAGEEAPPAVHPIHRFFAETPDRFVEETIKIAEERVERKRAVQEQQVKEVSDAAAPVFDKCPELKKYPYEIQGEIVRLTGERPDLPRKQVVQEAMNAAIKRLGLKTLTDEERQTAARNAMLTPSAGGYIPNSAPSHDPGKTANDFIAARRQLAKKARRQ